MDLTVVAKRSSAADIVTLTKLVRTATEFHDSVKIDDRPIITFFLNHYIFLFLFLERASMPQSNCDVTELITKRDISCESAPSQPDFDSFRSGTRL